MQKIIWDDSFRIGIEKIDLQHQKLFGFLNRLVDADHPDSHAQIISDTLTEMTYYCDYHVSVEEQYM